MLRSAATLADAATMPTPRQAIEVLYPGWALVADGDYRLPRLRLTFHKAILRRGDQWRALTLGTSTTHTPDNTLAGWETMAPPARARYLDVGAQRAVTVTGTALDLLQALHEGYDSNREANHRAALAATVLDLLDPPTRDATLTLYALAPDGFAAHVAREHARNDRTIHATSLAGPQ